MSEFEKWTLAISILSTVLSAVIAVLAIWGDWIRCILSPPNLRLRLRCEKGEIANHNENKARYYHLEVSNSRVWAPAKNVVVNLVQIDQLTPGQDWKREYETGPIPLAWQYSAHFIGYPDVGRERYCDLGFIVESQPFRISTQHSQERFESLFLENQRLRVHLVAVGDNAKSNRVVLELSWDGQWHEGSEEMAKHFTIKAVNEFQ